MQLHLQRAMHLLQSESFGVPPPQSHFLMQFILEVPPHKHRAMHRRIGTHFGQPNFIWFTIQLLHSPPLAGQVPHPQPLAGLASTSANTVGHKRSSISRTTEIVEGLFSMTFFWNESLKKICVVLACLLYILVQWTTQRCDLGYDNLLIEIKWSFNFQCLLLCDTFQPLQTNSFSAIECHILVCTKF